MNYDKYLKNAYPEQYEIIYTDKEYLSRRSIVALTGGQLISGNWNRVLKYREKISLELPLRSFTPLSKPTDKLHFALPECIIKNIDLTNKYLINLNISLALIERSFNQNKLKLLNELKTIKVLEEIDSLLKANNMQLSQAKINELILKKPNIEKIKGAERFAWGMYKIFEEINNAEKKPIVYDIVLLEKWCFWLLNEKIILRTQIISNPSQPGSSIGFLPRNIKPAFLELAEFINNKDKNLLCTRMAAVFATIHLGAIFKDEVNNLASLLSVYFVIGQSYGEILPYLNFGSILLNTNLEYLKQAWTNTNIENADVTYIMDVLLKNLNTSLINLNESIISLNIKDGQEAQEKSSSKPNNVKKIELNYEVIMHKYPSLSRRQIEFYLQHSTEGYSYTIRDFQQFHNSCQETARYSFENLVKNGLYEKNKVGKKIVYKTIIEKRNEV